jgi:hypothetical protein
VRDGQRETVSGVFTIDASNFECGGFGVSTARIELSQLAEMIDVYRSLQQWDQLGEEEQLRTSKDVRQVYADLYRTICDAGLTAEYIEANRGVMLEQMIGLLGGIDPVNERTDPTGYMPGLSPGTE